MEIFTLPDCALELIQESSSLLNIDHQILLKKLTANCDNLPKLK
jgi:hypothetical protein